ncbi:DUF4437 domain-containing protein [Flammeovirga yaeyamensis]|uniref:DUF4437 domain-containing protein n=1 Tax=Flammeovirga yaeyamensis TaxID=367791 RepID=A0AAX1NDI2_9BACT|nr:DUF4437 domain-containing protein [Flammeovirga yaeyamensis]MBB3696495.1 mannose-6-phosphate isomerase-like protein (cupin superfamily) [Flammeovirga yaeyamensis]NMF33175.1 DUF4437 domain-containing protein [Flammeovirga yaeyamensis]QWG05545.1 DUF4437 domain-containing protein [Flammeovirga yaeyamensis]
MYYRILNSLLIIGLFISCTTQNQKSDEEVVINNPTNKVKLSSEIVWEKLNPARGDKSPQAGTIFGDRKGEVPTGFLAKFVDGFSSPPHIHNVTYRAVVIKGTIHNDDPKAENMWMKPGSFWTQPQGEAHITSAKGEENIAYVEIDKGPYLVRPTDQAIDNGERPINIDVSNIVWLGSDRSNWVSQLAKINFLWEKDGLQGLFIKLPKNFKGELLSEGSIFHAVVISGGVDYTLPQNQELKHLDAGSYFTSTDRAKHTLSTKNESVIYIRTNGSIKVK